MITFRNFEGPSASCGESQFCSKNTPVGIDVPTTARGWNLVYGFFSVGETEGVKGGTEGNISPVGCPPKAEMTRSSGKQQAERTAVRAAPIVCPEESPLLVTLTDNFVVRNSRRGLTRRLRRGWWGCRPEGGSTFFRSERKYQRKPAARRLREKALYCPFLKEGVRNVARKLVGKLTHAIVRARAHSFPLSKRARLFPYAAYRRSASPQLAWGRLNQCELG